MRGRIMETALDALGLFTNRKVSLHSGQGQRHDLPDFFYLEESCSLCMSRLNCHCLHVVHSYEKVIEMFEHLDPQGRYI